jgi:hypothetical protein
VDQELLLRNEYLAGENRILMVLAKMAAKRDAGYRSLGYRVLDRAELYPAPASREPAL